MTVGASAVLGDVPDAPRVGSSRSVLPVIAVIVVAAAAAVVGALLWQSDEGSGAAAAEAERVADQAMATLRDGDGARAYSLACDAVRGEHSPDEYTELWLQQPRPESWEWQTTDLSPRGSGRGQAEVIGTAVVEGEDIPWSVFLVRENGGWRTCAFPED